MVWFGTKANLYGYAHTLRPSGFISRFEQVPSAAGRASLNPTVLFDTQFWIPIQRTDGSQTSSSIAVCCPKLDVLSAKANSAFGWVRRAVRLLYMLRHFNFLTGIKSAARRWVAVRIDWWGASRFDSHFNCHSNWTEVWVRCAGKKPFEYLSVFS